MLRCRPRFWNNLLYTLFSALHVPRPSYDIQQVPCLTVLLFWFLFISIPSRAILCWFITNQKLFLEMVNNLMDVGRLTAIFFAKINYLGIQLVDPNICTCRMCGFAEGIFVRSSELEKMMTNNVQIFKWSRIKSEVFKIYFLSSKTFSMNRK